MMKNPIKPLMFFALIALAIGCKDDEEPTLSNDEAAEMLAASLAANSGGITVMAEASVDAAALAVDANDGGRIQVCGYSDAESFNLSSAQGAAVSYAFSYSYTYELTCGQEVPQSLAVDATFSGDVDAPRLATEHSGTFAADVTALEDTEDDYLLNATYDCSGSFESKIGNKNSSSSTVSIDLEDVVINKISRNIQNGTASAVVAGEVTGKGAFSFSATVVFEGDGQATVTVNGAVYDVSLATGAVTKM